jgi:hypothetical protein
MQVFGRGAEFADTRDGVECTNQLDIEYGRHDSPFMKDCCNTF